MDPWRREVCGSTEITMQPKMLTSSSCALEPEFAKWVNGLPLFFLAVQLEMWR